MKSHFVDEEKIRERRENSGQIHIWEVSLRRQRETLKINFLFVSFYDVKYYC